MASKTNRPRIGGQPTRRGFTLVELLVVITIIGILMALLIPAVQSARAVARQNECLNNIKQLALAMTQYETSKGKLPGYVQSLKRGDQSYVGLLGGNLSNSTFDSFADRGLSRISWVTMILPEIEQQAFWDNVVDASVTAGDARASVVPIGTLTCPVDSDLTSLPDAAGTSYSANCGGWDLDNESVIDPSDVDRGDVPENGIFLNELLYSANVRSSKFRDGSSLTIMFAENRHKAAGDSAQGYSWMGVQGEDNPLSGLYGEQQLGIVWVANASDPIISQSSSYDDYHQAPISNEEPYEGSFYETRPAYARPDSAHPRGTFNVAFAGGNARGIRSDIDYTVYQRLMTSNGRKIVDPIAHDNTAETDIFIRLPTVQSSDYE